MNTSPTPPGPTCTVPPSSGFNAQTLSTHALVATFGQEDIAPCLPAHRRGAASKAGADFVGGTTSRQDI